MTGFLTPQHPDHPRLAYSMVNFWPLLEPFMAGRVCEIGAERGLMTRRLLARSVCALPTRLPASVRVSMLRPGETTLS